jgi:pimeloyl-[acyl-carrier protein] synthase
MASETGETAMKDSHFFTSDTLTNPYPVYQRLRSTDPVHWDEGAHAWLLTRYDDVTALLRDQRLSSDRRELFTKMVAGSGLEQMYENASNSMINNDAPRHTRLRGLVSKAFTPRAVEAMTDWTQKRIDELLDGVQRKGRMEFIDEFAYPLPVTVIAGLMGVPLADLAQFRKWSDDSSVLVGGGPAVVSQQALSQAMASTVEMRAYFQQIIAERRAKPQNDLFTAMIQAEEAGERLNEQELLANLGLMLIAGHETTTNLLGNGLLALLQHPDQFQKLKGDPSLVDSAVEEMLRYHGSVQFIQRVAREDVQIGGKTLQKGQHVFLCVAAAAHDPVHFPDPERFDITRQENKHVTFGAGPHFCLGAPLARLESRLAFATLVRRLPNLRLEGGPLKFRNNFNLRGLEKLPVVF